MDKEDDEAIDNTMPPKLKLAAATPPKKKTLLKKSPELKASLQLSPQISGLQHPLLSITQWQR